MQRRKSAWKVRNVVNTGKLGTETQGWGHLCEAGVGGQSEAGSTSLRDQIKRINSRAAAVIVEGGALEGLFHQVAHFCFEDSHAREFLAGKART